MATDMTPALMDFNGTESGAVSKGRFCFGGHKQAKQAFGIDWNSFPLKL